MHTILNYKTIAGLAVVALVVLYALFSTSDIQLAEPAQLPASIGDAPQEEPAPLLSAYAEIIDSCGPNFDGICVNMRSGPGTEFPAVMKLRTGMVLKVVDMVSAEGRTWYKIGFDGTLRYPERVAGDWYVAAEYAELIKDAGPQETLAGLNASSTKRIVIDRSDQMLYAYENGELFMQEPISTGLELTPTPRGQFWIYSKMPDRYMQGPLPGISEQYYDLPGVPWDLYFTFQGGAIHGAYWHNNFGQPWSHGCVNMPVAKAKELYYWADLGTPVLVRD